MNSSESARALTAALTSAWCLTAGPFAASLLPLSDTKFGVLAASLTALPLHQRIGLSKIGASYCPIFLWNSRTAWKSLGKLTPSRWQIRNVWLRGESRFRCRHVYKTEFANKHDPVTKSP